MEDRNKDLPLIVSEILIEMHEMKEDIREVKKDIREMRGDINAMRSDINEMRGDIRQLTKSITTLASSINVVVEESRKNTEMMLSVLNRYADMTNRRLDDHDDRIITLESK